MCRYAAFLTGDTFMKILMSMVAHLVVIASLSACSSGNHGATAPTPPPAAIAGIDTPKSVSVVTAN
jgi:hypothetical protein